MHGQNHTGRTLFAFTLVVILVACGQITEGLQHPALIADAEHGQLFGAAVDEHWLAPDDAVALMNDAIVFSLYPAAGPGRQCTIRLAQQRKEICAQPALDVEACAPVGKSILAISAVWEAAPRVAEELNPSNATYRALVSSWLNEQGIDDATPALDQLLRVDLEGDGTEEILISATRHRGSVRSAPAGDYSVTLLRKIVGDSVRTIPLQQDLYPESCEAQCEPQTSRVVAVLDVNGDGVLEVIAELIYFEGIERIIYSIHENGVKARLSWTCGV